MRHVLIYSPWEDTGGAGIALKRAIDHCAPGWSARHIRRADNWIHYPVDVEWAPNTSPTEAFRLFAEADVVHIMERPEAIEDFPDWQGKPAVVQYLGSEFREKPAAVSAEAQRIGALEAAGSHELLALAPEAYLLVGAVDLDALQRLRDATYVPSERVRIIHAPTDQSVKSTVAFLEAAERLKQQYPVDVDLIQMAPNAECLVRKARGDILYDQVFLGHGLNAIEAWGMGMPVVAGLADPRAASMFHAAYGAFPWVNATRDTIYDALEPLVIDATLRAEWGAIGRAFAHRVYAEPVVVAKTLALYERALDRVAV